jgi:hypothetical protein
MHLSELYKEVPLTTKRLLPKKVRRKMNPSIFPTTDALRASSPPLLIYQNVTNYYNLLTRGQKWGDERTCSKSISPDVLSMWCCKAQLDEQKSRNPSLHASLLHCQEIGFSAPNWWSVPWLVKGSTQLCTFKKRV